MEKKQEQMNKKTLKRLQDLSAEEMLEQLKHTPPEHLLAALKLYLTNENGNNQQKLH